MNNYWASWWHSYGTGEFELHAPWWISGSRSGADSICAAIRAESEEAARAKVEASYDGPCELSWRFVREMSEDWSPYCDRFSKADWMPEWPPVAETVT